MEQHVVMQEDSHLAEEKKKFGKKKGKKFKGRKERKRNTGS